MADGKYRRLACVECSGMFEQAIVRGPLRKYCDDCGDQVRKRHQVERLPRKKAACHAVHIAAAREVSCAKCGCVFCPLYGSKYREGGYCKPCADDVRRERSASGENAARAKRFGVARKYFNESLILERDGWRCQLCGVSTPKRLRGTMDDRAPEIDHIVPLSVGGAHLPENVQCACRKCNRKKMTRPLGQMFLMGFADVAVARTGGRGKSLGPSSTRPIRSPNFPVGEMEQGRVSA